MRADSAPQRPIRIKDPECFYSISETERNREEEDAVSLFSATGEAVEIMSDRFLIVASSVWSVTMRYMQ